MNNSILYTFHDIYLLIRNNFNFVIKTSLCCLAFGIVYSLFATKYYESYISIYPAIESDNMNNIMGVGSVLGLDLGQNSNSAFHIPDVINSTRLKRDIVNNKWNSKKTDNKINLIDYWDLKKENNGFLSLIFSDDEGLDHHKIAEQNAIAKLENNLYVFEEESGLIKIRVLMEEAQLASDISNYISDFLVQYIGTELKLKSTQYRQFLDNRLVEVEEQLKNAESELTSFRNSNPMAKDTPLLQNLRGQLIRNLEVEQQVFLTLRTQYEIARADELKEQPVLNILDIGFPSTNPYWPKNLLIYLISLFIGFMVSIMVLFSIDALSKKSSDIND
tara:strand:+ start:8916 stop:9911 length:996 start_codon:yes stop_codon:yes gene_type:complete